MKIFNIEMTVVDGVTASAIFERTDLKSARAAHYSVMASALSNPKCTEALSMVITSAGNVYENEYYNSERNK